VLRATVGAAALSLCVQAQTAPAPTPKLLADARAALGGEARLSAIQTFVIEGAIVRGQDLGAFAITGALPDRFVRIDNVVSVGPGTGVSQVDGSAAFSHHRNTTTLGFNGRQVIYQPSVPGWTRRPDVRPATEAELQALLDRARQSFVEVTLGMFVASFAGAPVQFAEASEDTDALIVTRSGSTGRLSLDSKTRLPRRFDDLTYSDYREIGGVKVPFRFVRATRTGAIVEEWRVKTVRHNVPVDDRAFRR
jgi:hypothetical protein